MATQIPSQVRGLNRLRYFALELIRLLSLIRDCSQARTPDYPPIVRSRAIRAACDVTRDVDVRTILRSREADLKCDCGLLAVAPIRERATTETYGTITKSDFTPRGDQLHARGPKKCRGLASAR